MSAGRRVLEVLGRSAGGIAAHVARVTEGLDGRDGLVVDISGPPDLPVPMPKAVRPLVIPDGLRGHVRAVRSLRSILREGAYEVVHAHGLRAGIDSGIAARGLNVIRCVSVHNLVRPDVTGGVRSIFYRWAEPLVVRLNHKVFAPSEEIAQHLRATIPGAAEKVDVVLLGVGEEVATMRSRDEVRHELGLSPDSRLIVTVSRLHPQKALHVLLEALSRLSSGVYLAIVGEGPLEADLKKQAAMLGVSERVAWLGFRDDVGDYLAAADVFCLSSRWEAVALAAKEAVLVDTPVVATDVGGMRELFQDGVSGRLVPKEDPSALATALRDVLEHPDNAETYARNARAALTERFSTAGMLDRLYRAYTEPV
jgi:glycosyltransferase involved in cell wall biosynthesis